MRTEPRFEWGSVFCKNAHFSAFLAIGRLKNTLRYDTIGKGSDREKSDICREKTIYLQDFLGDFDEKQESLYQKSLFGV